MFSKDARRFVLVGAGLLTLFILNLGMAQPAMASQPMAPVDSPAVAGELVVAFDPGTSRDVVEAVASQSGASVLEYNADSGLALFVLDTVANADVRVSVAADQAVALADTAYVMSASPNYIYQVSADVTFAEESSLPDSRTVVSADAAGDVTTMDMPISATTANLPGDVTIPWGWLTVEADLVYKDKAKAVTIAFLDTGFAFKHPDGKAVKSGYDFVNDDKSALDDNGVGTHVAAIAMATTSKIGDKRAAGAPGISNGSAYAIKVLDSTGAGSLYDLAAGIDAAVVTKGVQVINLGVTGPPSAVLETSIKAAVDAGMLVVVAAGNNNEELDCDGAGDHTTNDVYPACYRTTLAATPDVISAGANNYGDSIIVVAAMGDKNAYDYLNTTDYGADPNVVEEKEKTCQYTFSNFNSFGATNVDIAAPGGEIYSAWPHYPVSGGYNEEGYATGSGTAQATAYVSAAAARVWAQHTSKVETWTAAQVKAKLVADAVAINGTASADCWPQETPGTDTGIAPPYLWLPGAMDISGMWGYLYNADTGAALPSGTSTDALVAGKSVAKDKSCAPPPIPGAKGKNYCDWYDQFYLSPIAESVDSVTLSVKSKSNGVGNYAEQVLTAGWNYMGYIAAPAKADRWSMVVSWSDPATYDVNGYLNMEATGAKYYDGGATTGDTATWPAIDWLGSYFPVGTANTSDMSSGLLTAPPFARIMFDSNDSASNYYNAVTGGDGLAPFDSLSIDATKGIATNAGDHLFVVALSLTDGTDMENVPDVCVHIWLNGVIKDTFCLDGATTGGSGTSAYWYVGKLNGSTWTPVNTLHDDESSINGGVTVFSEPDGTGTGPVPTGD